MLRIGKMTDYALLLTNQLVSAGDELYTTESLAEATQLSPATVRKLLKQLVDGGIAISYRGAKGGYKLASDPTTFTIADVINAIEGPIALTQCSTDKGDCELVATCGLKMNWSYVNQMVAELLQHITLADMSRRFSEQRVSFTSTFTPGLAQSSN